jgi:uncharacterized cupin superfamily protein
VSEPVNVLELPTQNRAGRPAGYRSPKANVGRLLGAESLGATAYDLDPGQSVCPYHFEHGREEWLLVLSGRPALRTPRGEEALEPWDVVCFPDGPDGAHKVTNRTEAPARVLVVSTKGPVVWVYPDSGKVGTSVTQGLFRFADAVGYWHGEEQVSD